MFVQPRPRRGLREDPNGQIRYIERNPGDIVRYRFGTKTCDFLICRHCGVYMGATMDDETTPGYSTTRSNISRTGRHSPKWRGIRIMTTSRQLALPGGVEIRTPIAE